ncbi:MAG TPA: DinB family protein [Kouleothrix sp.]|uniref:DinB family protein n=1 Tax=Kouleothrix sp. TaxID=2779161 RepID=UPI002BF265A1|nr:DinB family protein [Kouleothrix sp.]HRC75427.1 DinB family protein [Kouleothrix sp.]
MSDALARIRAILETTPLRWSQLAATVDAELLAERPAAGEWSALECLEHLLDTERLVFPVRLAALRDGRDIPAFDPGTQGTQGAASRQPAELAASFAELRAANLAALATVNEAMFANQGIHSELGPVTLGQLLHEWATHDLDHTIQAERALIQPFLRGCGPWHIYFTANRIEA